MPWLWDYNAKELVKTKSGRLKLLERSINYGPSKGEKIKLSEVKKNWTKLMLFPGPKRLMELLIWNKYKEKMPQARTLHMHPIFS